MNSGGKPAAAASRAAKPAAVSPKKATGASPAKDESAAAAESEGPPEVEFPAELAGGIPRPKGKKGMNFDQLAIDTSKPLNITGRKSSRGGGLTAHERKKATLIMGGVMGGCVLAIGLVVVIWAAFINNRQPAAAPQPAAATGKSEAEANSSTSEETSDESSAKPSEKPAKKDQGKNASKSEKPAEKPAKPKPKPKKAAAKTDKPVEMPAPDLDVQPADKPAKKAAPKKEETGGFKTPDVPRAERRRVAASRAASSTALPQDHGRVAFVLNALVTGAGGFLRPLPCRTVDGPRQARSCALCRRPSRQLAALGVETLQADLRDREATVAACRGMDVVFHAAGVAGIGGPWKRYYQSNTLAARHVVEGCRRHGVARLVYTSSPSVTFDGRDQQGVDESAPYAVRWLSHYSHSKALAEQDVLAANDPPRLMTCALRPHLIWGPGDQSLAPRLLALAAAGRLRRVGDGTNLIDTAYVENVAEAHLLAADALSPGARVAGRAYFISQGEPVNCWQWIDSLLTLAGLAPIRKRMSLGAAWAIGASLEFLYRLLGVETEPPMTRFLAAQLARSHYYDVPRGAGGLRLSPAGLDRRGIAALGGELAAMPANRGVAPPGPHIRLARSSISG